MIIDKNILNARFSCTFNLEGHYSWLLSKPPLCSCHSFALDFQLNFLITNFAEIERRINFVLPRGVPAGVANREVSPLFCVEVVGVLSSSGTGGTRAL